MGASYIRKQGRRYWARFQVPRDVRDALGKSEEWVNLQTDDMKLAAARTHRAASDFRARVLEARGRVGTVEADALLWRRTIESEGTDKDDVSVATDAAIAAAADRYVKGGHAAVTRAANLYHEGSKGDALLEMGGPSARKFVEIAFLGRKPLISFVAPWATARANEVESKTAAMDRTAVDRFVEAFPLLTDVTKVAVHDWTQRRRASDDVAPQTVQREMSGVRSFWLYLRQRGEVATDAPDPFEGLRFKVRQKDTVRAKRQGFDPKEVAALYSAARKRSDDELADLIALAAYTGARREELCALKVGNVSRGWIKVEDAKSEAGTRDVPIHPNIVGRLASLIGRRKIGFVFAGLDTNKYGKRGDGVGKRFARLKTAMGHGETKTLHSIRHTVVHLLEAAGVSENLTADIVGHKKTSMSYGLYSGRGATRKLLGAAIEKVCYPRPLGR